MLLRVTGACLLLLGLANLSEHWMPPFLSLVAFLLALALIVQGSNDEADKRNRL